MPLHQPGRAALGATWRRSTVRWPDGFTCRQRQWTLSYAERAHQKPAVTPEYQRIVGGSQSTSPSNSFLRSLRNLSKSKTTRSSCITARCFSRSAAHSGGRATRYTGHVENPNGGMLPDQGIGTGAAISATGAGASRAYPRRILFVGQAHVGQNPVPGRCEDHARQGRASPPPSPLARRPISPP